MYRIPYENEQITKTIAAPYAPVDFTDAEKQQFRDNIGAGTGSGGGGRNLLDNGWFTVNQRGITTLANSGMFADRWGCNLNGNSGSINNTTHIVTLNKTAAASIYMYQKIEQELSDTIDGETVTYSVMLGNGQILTTTFVYNANVASEAHSLGVSGLDLWDEATAKTLSVRVSQNMVVTIKAVKLELGSVSTLANDMPPDYTTELLKCMRYFRRIDELYIIGISQTAQTLGIPLQLSVGMRATPTIQFYTMQINKNGSWVTVPANVSQIHGTQMMYLYFGANMGTTATTVYLTYFNKMDLSADL